MIPVTEPMCTIAPLPRRRMCGKTCLETKKAPLRLVSRTRSHPFGGDVVHDACAVDHDVDTAKGPRHFLDGRFDGRLVPHVDAQADRPAASSGDPIRGRVGSVFVDVKGRNPGSFFGKPLADRPADPGRTRPRDDGHLILEPHERTSSTYSCAAVKAPTPPRIRPPAPAGARWAARGPIPPKRS